MTAAACPPPRVLTMGEPAGIGFELALKVAGRRAWPHALPVIHIGLAAPVALGQPTPADATSLIEALRLAAGLAANADAGG